MLGHFAASLATAVLWVLFELRTDQPLIDMRVLAERLRTTRGALYKTLHDARRRLRAELGR